MHKLQGEKKAYLEAIILSEKKFAFVREKFPFQKTAE